MNQLNILNPFVVFIYFNPPLAFNIIVLCKIMAKAFECFLFGSFLPFSSFIPLILISILKSAYSQACKEIYQYEQNFVI